MTIRLVPLAIASLALTLPAAGFAQTKTDGLWRGAGGAALSVTSGNTSSNSIQLNADATKATSDDKITLGAAAQRAQNKSNGTTATTADKWSLAGQYDRNLNQQLFAFGKLGLESDKLTKLDLRTSLAAGLGYHVIANDSTSFDVFGGVGYTTDTYGVTQTIGSRVGTRFSRSSLYLGESSSHKLSSTVSFKERLDLYPGLRGDKAMLAKFTAGLVVAMNSTMNLSVGLTDTYNSKPPAGTKKNDVGLFTGVNVKFGAN